MTSHVLIRMQMNPFPAIVFAVELAAEEVQGTPDLFERFREPHGLDEQLRAPFAKFKPKRPLRQWTAPFQKAPDGMYGEVRFGKPAGCISAMPIFARAIASCLCLALLPSSAHGREAHECGEPA